MKQALDSLKQRAAPGRDGLTTEMVSSEGLMVFWWLLFNDPIRVEEKHHCSRA